MPIDANREELPELQRSLLGLGRHLKTILSAEETASLKEIVRCCEPRDAEPRDEHGMLKSLLRVKTALLFADAIDADRNVLLAILLEPYAGIDAKSPHLDKLLDGDVKALVESLGAVGRFSTTNIIANQDNYRGLLLAMAGDIRVIIVLIVRCLALMRSINEHPDTDWVRRIAFEANYLYAQLAHRMGLYKVKGELEDLALKYTNRDVYTMIARKLNETKRARDAYVEAFIKPVRERLEEEGLKFEIKGRTKSISSIWAKIQKQKVDLGGIYDLFAIRIIIDSDPATPKKERSDCWNVFSIVTSMYTHNPARMRDWLSIPKSNGYESLHCTVHGPESKWVEVQIRSRSMDNVAEKGLAAHWRYKGGHADANDAWMRNVREILETAGGGPMELVKNTKKGIYSDEVYVFTPKGDVEKLQAGSTVLDFAFHIHTRVGSQCVGAIVNGRHEKISYKLKSGDTVEVTTSSTQKPKQDWLSIVVTSKARNKIRQSLNEARLRQATLGKEMLDRRAKNRKIEFDESVLMKLVKRYGYKFVNDFYFDLAAEKLDASKIISDYLGMLEPTEQEVKVSAEEYVMAAPEKEKEDFSSDVVTIGEGGMKGINYKFPKCCSPVYGDDVFGFISFTGVINIHKCDCPNAAYIKRKYGDRLIRVNWCGNACRSYPATIQVTGTDDIGIVTNISSIINKEPGVTLRGISIDSNDGLFQGVITVGVADIGMLKQLIKKIATVKGVKSVSRY